MFLKVQNIVKRLNSATMNFQECLESFDENEEYSSLDSILTDLRQLTTLIITNNSSKSTLRYAEQDFEGDINESGNIDFSKEVSVRGQNIHHHLKAYQPLLDLVPTITPYLIN